MSFESNFQYQGTARLGYFWANPNHAAAVLVTLLPLFWAIRFHIKPQGRNLWLYGALIGAELGWSLLIGWTCSRGALVAWFGALAAFATIAKTPEPPSKRQVRIFWLCSALLFIATLVFTDVGQRIGDIADGDRSALNRLQIWANGLRLIAAAPLSGWGAGNSGNALLHWFEPVDSMKDYSAVVSTYLHFTAEFGLPALTAVLTLAIFSFIIGWRAARNAQPVKRVVVVSATTGLVAFGLAGFFSILWVNSGVAPALGVCLIVIWGAGFGGVAQMRLALSYSAAAAVLAAGALYVAGIWIGASDEFEIQKRGGTVVLTKRGAIASTGEVSVLIDQLVLGTYYGRSIRKLAASIPHWKRISIRTMHPGPPLPAQTEILVCGALATEQEWPAAIYQNVVLIAPLGPYRESKSGSPKAVILPEYDEFGDAATWMAAWPHKVRTLRNSGQDCSSRLNELSQLLVSANAAP